MRRSHHTYTYFTYYFLPTSIHFEVRDSKFIPKKSWIVCGVDDGMISVYNVNTCEKVTSFEAHNDYIRAIAVHPTLPLILSSSDDCKIKLWDWEKDWKNTAV